MNGYTVALDAQSTVGKKTGIGHYAAQLIDALGELHDGNRYLPLDWGRDPLMRIPRRLQWQQVELPRRAKAAQADLLHVTGFDPPLWRPCKVVVTLHDLIGMLFPGNMPPVGRFYWNRWLPFSMRFAHHVIVPSHHTAQDVTRLLGIPSEQVTVIYYGIHPRFCPITDAGRLGDVRTRLNLPQRFVLYVGTLEPRKGLDTLVEACAQLRAQHAEMDDLALVLAGSKGWMMDTLFKQVKDLGLENQIRFLDYVPHADLPVVYTLAQATVLPSRYEGFGFPLAESMACGTPVIYAANSSMPEVCGDAGLPFQTDHVDELAHQLVQVLTQPDRVARLRTAGLARASRFTWEQAARATVAVYEQVLRS